MRETRTHGSEGGGTGKLTGPSYPYNVRSRHQSPPPPKAHGLRPWDLPRTSHRLTPRAPVSRGVPARGRIYQPILFLIILIFSLTFPESVVYLR